MRVRKLIFIMSFLFLLGCNMSGCKLFSTEAIVDTKTDEDGRLVLLDTLRNWQDFRATVDLQVANEKAGKMPPGVATWNDHWLRRIEENRASRENASRYIGYIVEARRSADLPELEGDQS